MMVNNMQYNEFCQIFSFNNMRIFIDPVQNETRHIGRAMMHKKERRVHIFITDAKTIENENFKLFLESLFQTPLDEPVVTIHVSRSMPDLDFALRQHFIHHLNTAYVPRISVYKERGPIDFRVGPRYGKILRFEWNQDKLNVFYILDKYKLTGYTVPNPGAVQNYVQAKYPNLFKDDIIKRFKESCPSRILKVFHDDNDIWDYILEEGEWKR